MPSKKQVEAKTETGPADLKVVDPQERELPLIEPKACLVQSAGFSFKTLICTAPEGLTLADLNESPECWRLVQRDRSGLALAEFDRVEVRWQTHVVEARVNWADGGQAILFAIKRHSKPARELPLFKDEHYEVRWAAEGGFSYWRSLDNVRMSPSTWPTPEACKSELLRQQYPASIS